MALVRLALKKHLHQRVFPPSSFSAAKRLLATEASDSVTREETTDGKDVSISEAKGRRGGLFPDRSRSRGLWSNNPRNIFPVLSGLERALLQASGNISRLFENLNLSPWSASGRVKEQDDQYNLRFDMPGLSKEYVKISVHNGVLTIKGQHKEEEEGEEAEDEYWSSRSYGYYENSFGLPDDAKVDEIKASLKDGVLCINIPRSETAREDLKEVDIY